MNKNTQLLLTTLFAIVFLSSPHSVHAQYYESDPTGYEQDSSGYESDTGFGYGYESDPYGYESDPTGSGYVSDPYGYGYESDPYGYGYESDLGYGSGYSNDWTSGCGNACIYPTSSAYGSGGTQGYGGGWGMPYSNYGNYRGNYGYTPVYGIGGTNPMYASAAMPMYQQPQYMQPTYQQSVQNTQWTWGMVNNSPVVYGKSIGTSVDLFGTYPSCVIYFLPTSSPYTHGLRWSGINIAQATMSYVGQVTGEGYMEVPYDGREYSLTVWNQKGEMRTCSTR